MMLGIIEESRGGVVCAAHCDNPECYNFTTNHDLSGSHCSDECWVACA